MTCVRSIPRLVHRNLLQVLALGLLVNHIEQRLRAEVAGDRGADGLVGEHGLLVADLDGLVATATSGRVREKLRLAAAVHGDEPEDGLLDGATDGQQTVVLQERGFLVAEGSSDFLALLLGDNDAVERVIEDVVLRGLSAYFS